MAESTATGSSRVKVYVLNDHDNWEERCMGHVRCERDLRTNAFVIKVFADDSGRVALCSPVRSMRDAAYQRQEDTIISWQEDMPPASHAVPTEIALSFAEEPACKELWEKLVHINSLFTHHEQTALAKQMLPNTLPPSPQQIAPQHHLVASHGVLGPTLNLPSSIAPQQASPAMDPLMSTADSPLISSSTRDNNNNHRNQHASLVDSAPDMTHPSRFFDDNMDASSPWSADPIEDVIFRDNPNVLFLGSPSTLVPPSVNSDPAAAAGFVMPEPSRAGIEDLYRAMSEQGAIHIPCSQERIISEVSNGEYVSKMCNVFRECEKAVDIEGLAMLYHIVRCLFTIGTGSVLEVLVHEKNLMDIVGCLEYDPEHIAELEHAQAESKQCADERKAECGNAENEQHFSKNDVSVMSAERPEDSQSPVNKDADHRNASQSHRESATKETARGDAHDAREQHGQSSDSKLKEDDSDVRETSAAKMDTSQPSHLETNKQCENEKVCVDEAAAVVATSDNTSNVKQGGALQKNVSEETTSSGNLAGDGGERRFAVRVHRDFLERKVAFKSVVPITDPNVVAKIHQNYRVSYIRDAILSRSFDENVSSALSGVILCNNVDILMYFISGSSALQELFNRLKSTVDQRKAAEIPAAKERADVQTLTSSEKVVERTVSFDSKNSGCIEKQKDISSKQQALPRSGEQSSDEVARPLAQPKAVNSSGSGFTESTADSKATEVLDPTASKGQSSRTEPSGRNDSGSGEPRSSASDGDNQEELCSMLGLLRELCSVAKTQQSALKNRFHSMLMDLGVMEVVVSLLLDKDPTIRSLCCDILFAAVIHDQTEFRSHILKNVIVPEKPEVKRIGIPLRSAPVADSKTAKAVSVSTSCGDAGVAQEPAQEPIRKHETGSGREAIETVEEDRALDARGNTPAVACSKDASIGSNGERDENVKEKRVESTCSPPRSASPIESDVRHMTATATEDDKPVVTASYATPEKQQEEIKEGEGMGRLQTGESDEKFASGKLESENGGGIDVRKDVGCPEMKAQEDERFPLLPAMVEVVCKDQEGNVALPVLELLRKLLEPISMRTQCDKEVFLDLFYERFISRLIDPISRCVKSERERNEGNLECGPDENASHICDLLSFCVSHHAYRGRYFVLAWDVGGKIAELLKHRKAYMRLAALRFIRACVEMGDDMLDRYILREKLLEPVMNALRRNGRRDNLTSSAILHVVGFTLRKGRVELLRHIVDEYSSILEQTSDYSSLYADAVGGLKKMLSKKAEDGGNETEKNGSVKDEENGNGNGKGSGGKGEDGKEWDVEMKDVEKCGSVRTEVERGVERREEDGGEVGKKSEVDGTMDVTNEVKLEEDGQRQEEKKRKRGGVSVVKHGMDGEDESRSDEERSGGADKRRRGCGGHGASGSSSVMRLSLCRSAVRSAVRSGEGCYAEQGLGEAVGGMSETSGESGEEAVVQGGSGSGSGSGGRGGGRGRMASGGIETCTQAVMKQEGGGDLVGREDGKGAGGEQERERERGQGERTSDGDGGDAMGHEARASANRCSSEEK